MCIGVHIAMHYKYVHIKHLHIFTVTVYRCITILFTEILLQILGGLYNCDNNFTLPIPNSVLLDTVQWNHHICKVDESVISGHFSIPVLLLCAWMG